MDYPIALIRNVPQENIDWNKWKQNDVKSNWQIKTSFQDIYTTKNQRFGQTTKSHCLRLSGSGVQTSKKGNEDSHIFAMSYS